MSAPISFIGLAAGAKPKRRRKSPIETISSETKPAATRPPKKPKHVGLNQVFAEQEILKNFRLLNDETQMSMMRFFASLKDSDHAKRFTQPALRIVCRGVK